MKGKDIPKLFKILDKYNISLDELDFYFDDNDELIFAVNTNDIFIWGAADCELIDDLELLENCLELAKNDGLLLYAAKKLGMRPQGAAYKLLEEDNWKYFDECGPKRKVELGNPDEQP